MPIVMDLRVEDESWHALPDLDALCQRALDSIDMDGKSSLHTDILLTDNHALEALNRDWRGKQGPTDVLSFPAEQNPQGFLGDIAIAYGIAARDADASGKSLASHLSHLLVHGLLHLIGHDHIDETEAGIMEQLEREALARIGIDDPYSRIAQS